MNNHVSKSRRQYIKVDDAFQTIGVGKFQRHVLLATGTCFMADSLVIIVVSILIRKLQKLWNFDDSVISNIMSCLFMGATVGTMILGPLADKIGRKPVLLHSSSIISIFGLCMALCQSYEILFVVVFCLGIGIGGLTVPFDILAEFLPNETRGYYLLSIKYFWTIGSMLAPCLAYISFELADSWRLLCIFTIIPSGLSFISGAYIVPESPRWLVSTGRKEEALQILRSTAQTNGLDPYKILPPDCELEDESTEDCDFLDLFKVSFLTLLVKNRYGFTHFAINIDLLTQPRWRKSFFTLAAVWASYCFSFYGTILTMTRIFDYESAEYYYYADEDAPDFDYFALFLSSAAEIFGTAASIVFIDKIGRIKSLVLFFILGGLSVFSLCAVDGFTEDRWAVISFALIARAAEMGAACVTWVVTVELLSTEILSTGHSAVNFAAKFGAFLTPFLVEGDVSIVTIGAVLLVVNLAAAFMSSTLLETHGIEIGKAVLIEEAKSFDTIKRAQSVDVEVRTVYREMKSSTTFS